MTENKVDADHLRALLATIKRGYRLVLTEEDFRELPVGAYGYFSNYFPNDTFHKMESGRWYNGRRFEGPDFTPPMPFTRHDYKDLVAEVDSLVELLLDNQSVEG